MTIVGGALGALPGPSLNRIFFTTGFNRRRYDLLGEAIDFEADEAARKNHGILFDKTRFPGKVLAMTLDPEAQAGFGDVTITEKFLIVCLDLNDKRIPTHGPAKKGWSSEMSLTIEKTALQTVLYSTLSCRCPISESTESQLMQSFQALGDQEMVDLEPFLAIADQDPVPTPLHIFTEFCTYSKPDPTNFAIVQDDALRYFSSKFHFDRVLQGLNPLIVHETPGFLVAHMLAPVRYEHLAETGRAIFTMGGDTVEFTGLFVPPGWDSQDGDWVGLHLGAVVTKLTDDQVKMVLGHLAFIKAFPKLTAKAGPVDFLHFQEYGDYRAIVAGRFGRYY